MCGVSDSSGVVSFARISVTVLKSCGSVDSWFGIDGSGGGGVLLVAILICGKLCLELDSVWLIFPKKMEDSGKIKKQEEVVKVKQKPKEEALRNLHKFKTAKLSGFYIMHLEDRPLNSSIVDSKETKGGTGIVQSHCGHLTHFYVPPTVEVDVHVFRIAGPRFLKLNHGTWHAGPLFEADNMEYRIYI
ncbi:hypothetical protein Pint_21733 [Pistacia integerrima]|uniref:Uncharacterized protein n=1 Tax=Pistacia integerrima TaxID=434235 RepID=A0ACC0XCF9_9ROSI|nr:hypothetical protein Pint_21733 [Pistacia integerrima]